MRFERTEIKTGIFFVVTFGLLLLVVLYLAAPDVFSKRKEFEIFFDNAGGLKPGAAVNLAGRKIGQVLSIESPVAKKVRPRPEMEVLAVLRVDANAKVFRDATARMVAYGLLAEVQIDFVRGNEESGLATSGDTFIGEREGGINDTANKAIKTLEPLAAAAEGTLKDLKVTVGTLNAFFGQGSDLQASIANIRKVGENLGNLTAKDAALAAAIENIKTLTGKLSSDDGSLLQAIAKLKDAADQLTAKQRLAETIDNLRSAAARLDRLLSGVEPQLRGTVRNVEQLTDTLKRQPWRVIWPTTKKYPEDSQPKPTPTPPPKPPRKKKR
ncbi:MAG: MCE family protein [Verrucomicrobia bacterium]|nr:MCE family protein [Verrucomicrobiota bacterium]